MTAAPPAKAGALARSLQSLSRSSLSSVRSPMGSTTIRRRPAIRPRPPRARLQPQPAKVERRPGQAGIPNLEARQAAPRPMAQRGSAPAEAGAAATAGVSRRSGSELPAGPMTAGAARSIPRNWRKRTGCASTRRASPPARSTKCRSRHGLPSSVRRRRKESPQTRALFFVLLIGERERAELADAAVYSAGTGAIAGTMDVSTTPGVSQRAATIPNQASAMPAKRSTK
jgi:hypothetical protein